MIAIVDSGSGNLRSVEKAIAHVGGRPRITSDPDEVRRADRIVVPGQGAFGACVAELGRRGLTDAVKEAIAAGTPYLGICLGLQILFDSSEEGGAPGERCAGLGWLAGEVVRFRPEDRALKVPHMGWNEVRRAGAAAAAGAGAPNDDPLLRGIPDGAHVYFVHSYRVVPRDPAVVALTCDYAGSFCAAIRKDNVFACQFHPEKSQRVGLRLLESFVGSSVGDAVGGDA